MFRHVRTEGGSLRGAPALALLVLLAACGGGSNDGGSTASAKGKVNLLVRDAPFPYAYVDTASVVIEEIRVKNASTGVWTTVYTGPTDVDLVPLSGGNSLPLTQATLDVGTYDAVRVIVSGGEVMLAPSAFAEGGNALYTTANGRLKFPSASQSGLKVQIRPPIQVVTQLSSDLVLDFDLSKNFVFNGPVTHPPGVKSVIFTPVVRATNESMNGSIGVTVHGDNLTPGDTSDDVLLEGATVEAYANGDLDLGGPVVATAGTDSERHGRALGPFPGHVRPPGPRHGLCRGSHRRRRRSSSRTSPRRARRSRPRASSRAP